MPQISKRNEAVTLPFKPSSNMLASGVQAGGVSPDVAWRMYRAMLNAALADSSSLG
jgi:hypothetical protein